MELRGTCGLGAVLLLGSLAISLHLSLHDPSLCTPVRPRLAVQMSVVKQLLEPSLRTLQPSSAATGAPDSTHRLPWWLRHSQKCCFITSAGIHET